LCGAFVFGEQLRVTVFLDADVDGTLVRTDLL
jgi:hypothetical protein